MRDERCTWFWTDDLARLLVEDGVAPDRVADWLRHPVAHAAAEADPLEMARRLLEEANAVAVA